MKAYEAIKLLKADRKEFLEQYGIKSHMSKIPAELEAELFGVEKKIQAEPEPAPTVDTPEAIPVAKEACPYTAEQVELGIRCLGAKAPQWKWRHILNA